MNTSLDVLSSVIPQLYYEADSNLVDILEQYYKWLDGEFVNVAEVRSADAEQYFVDKMLEEYAPGIEKTSGTNERLLIKYATELFRAKGTPRAVSLFFRLVYQVNADVSFPRDQLFKTSDAEYLVPQFVEVTRSAYVDQYLNQFVTATSGGTMYVEAVHRIGTRVILLVSDVDGDISQGAAIYTTPETRKGASKVVGSLTGVRIDTSFDGFVRGERVTLRSGSGKTAAGYISETSDLGTQATFDLVSGGVGMTMYPEITISERTMRLSGVSTTGGTLFDEGAAVSQILYEGVIGEEDGDEAFNDYSQGDSVVFKELDGANTVSEVTVNVVAVEPAQDAGVKLIVQSSAPSANVLASNHIDGFSNTATLAVTSIDAAAEVVAPDTTVKLSFATNEGPFAIGDEVYQYDGGQSGAGKITFTPTANTIEVEIVSGEFVPGSPIYNSSNTVILTPTDIEQFIGVNNITGTFYASGDISVGNTSATVDLVSEGSEAEFAVKSIRGQRMIFVPGPLDASASEFYGNNYVFDGTVNQYGIPVGTISEITLRSNGQGYDYPPIATVKQPAVTVNTFDINVGSTEGYVLGEYVQQTGIADGTFDIVVEDTSAFFKDQIILRAIDASAVYSFVEYVNPATSTIGVRAIGGDQNWTSNNFIKRIDENGNQVSAGSNTVSSTATTDIATATGQIVAKTADTLTIATTETFTVGGLLTGRLSGNARTIVSITDVSSDWPDQNSATIKGQLTRTRGTISSVTVQYTEPGFRDSEPVEVLIDGNVVATGTAVTGAFGSFRPTFTSPGSKPSGGKALYDGDYYQHLSYEIKTAVDIDQYPNNKEFLQVAGMKMFIHNETESNATAQLLPTVTVSGDTYQVDYSRNASFFFDDDPVETTSIITGWSNWTLDTIDADVNEYSKTAPELLYLGGNYAAGGAFPFDQLVLQTNVTNQFGTDGSTPTLEFILDGDEFQFRTLGTTNAGDVGPKVFIEVDGVYTNAVGYDFPASQGTDWIFGVKFKTSKRRRVRINGDYSTDFGDIRVRGTLVDPTPSVPYRSFYFLGDSITEGVDITRFDKWPQRVMDVLNLGQHGNGGVGGTGYLEDQSGAATTFEGRINDVLTAIGGSPPSVCVVAGGINDNAFTDVQVEAAALSLFQSLRTGAPDMTIIALSCFAPQGGPDAATTSRSQAIANAAAQVSNCHYVDVLEIYDDPNWSTYFDAPDTTHPRPAGMARMAEVIAEKIEPLL